MVDEGKGVQNNSNCYMTLYRNEMALGIMEREGDDEVEKPAKLFEVEYELTLLVSSSSTELLVFVFSLSFSSVSFFPVSSVSHRIDSSQYLHLYPNAFY